jgi:4-hydroxy-3-polyprenylbenzoate decarboxylase
MKLVVGISGASGAIYGVRLMQLLRERADIETHLVTSEAAAQTLKLEMGWSVPQVRELADHHYDNTDIAARLSSGSFKTDGMIIIPCSISTVAAVAGSLNHNLMTRAADVTLKERRKLVMVVRETPLHLGHLRQLTTLAELGAVILPPMPAFYHAPKTIDDIIAQTIGKVLDQFNIEHSTFKRWDGPG